MALSGSAKWPMVKLGEVLTPIGVSERITNTANETFVTVKTKGQGAVQRVIGTGKTPRPFTGYRIATGNFIYSRIDARHGAFAVVPEELDGAVVSKDFPIFDIAETLHPSYLMHYAASGILARLARTRSHGATNRQRIKEEVLLNFEIPLPPLDEQRRIAHILDKSDFLMQQSRGQSDQLQKLVSSRFIDSFGSIKATVPLGEIVTAKPDYGIGAASIDYLPEVGRYIRITDISDDGRLHTDSPRSPDLKEKAPPNNKRVKPGDLLIARTGATVGKSYLHTKIDDQPYWYAGYLIRFRIDPSIVAPEIVFDFMHTEAYWSWVDSRKRTVAQPNINAQIYSQELNVPIPSPTATNDYLCFRAAIERLRSMEERRFSRLQELHQSLSTRAFQGEV